MAHLLDVDSRSTRKNSGSVVVSGGTGSCITTVMQCVALEAVLIVCADLQMYDLCIRDMYI